MIKKYLVKIKSDVLGDSFLVLTETEAKKFNMVVSKLIDRVDKNNSSQTYGMFTVSEYDGL